MNRLAPLLLLLVAAPAVATSPAEPAAATPATGVTAVPAPAPLTGTGTAGNAPPAPAWAPQLRREAQAVLHGPDFRGEETSRDLVPRDWLRRLLEPAQQQPDKPPDLRWIPVVAEVVKWLVVALLAAALAWLLWRGWQWLAPRVRQGRPAASGGPLREATSLVLPDVPLPAGVSGAARAAWAAGDPDLALSLLYRGALRALDQRYRIALPASATEGECLRRARASGKAVVGSGFAPLVQAWMALAYARRLPDDFEQLLDLYTRHFEPGTGEETA